MIREGMVYFAVAGLGKHYAGGNQCFRLPDGHSNSGNRELRKKLGSMDHNSNVDSSNQVKGPVDIIVEAEVTIHIQMKLIWTDYEPEDECGRSRTKQEIALRAAELELQSCKIVQQVHMETTILHNPLLNAIEAFRAPVSIDAAIHDYRNGSAQSNGYYGGLEDGQIHNRSKWSICCGQLYRRRRDSEIDIRRDAYEGQALPAGLT